MMAGKRFLRAGMAVLSMSALLAAGVALIGPVAPAGAVACDTSWKHAADGDWGTAANWTAGVPTNGSNACIKLAGTYTVTLTGGSPIVTSLTLGGTSGAQTLAITATCADGNGVLTAEANSTIGALGTIALTDTTGGSCTDPLADFYQASGTLTNAGTIHAVAATADKYFLEGNITNTGTIRVDDATTLFADVGTLTNSAGTINATGSGMVNVVNNSTYAQGGGTTSGTSTTPVLVAGGALAYTGTGASTITQVENATTITGNIAAGQTLNLDADCTYGHAILEANANWTNKGTINLTDDTGGSCGDYFADIYQPSGTLTNAGTIHAIAAATDRYLEGNVTNTGTISIDNAATIFVDVGTLTNSAGTINATGTGMVKVYNGGNYTQGGGTTSGTSTTPVLVQSGALKYSGTGASTITEKGNTTTITGNIAAGQTLNIEADCTVGHAIVQSSISWTNKGVINLMDAPGGGCGYFADLYQPSGTFTNSGTVHVAAGAAATRYIEGNAMNKGTLVVDAGAPLGVDAGTFTNAATGIFEMHIASPTSYALIGGSNAIKLGGTLAIVSSYTPALGASFPIIQCASCEKGKFAIVTGQSIPGGLGYLVTSKGTGTTLAVKKAADLSLTGSAPSPVVHGTNFAYSYTVHNAGPNTASGSKLTDTLPANVTFVSASAGCTAVGAKVTCAIGNLVSSASVNVTITVKAGIVSTFSNIATVAATTVDVTPADATKTIAVTIT